MKIEVAALFLALTASASAFVPAANTAGRSNTVSLNILKDDVEKAELDKALGREVRIFLVTRTNLFRVNTSESIHSDKL